MIKDICSTLNQLGYLILCNGCYYLVKLKNIYAEGIFMADEVILTKEGKEELESAWNT